MRKKYTLFFAIFLAVALLTTGCGGGGGGSSEPAKISVNVVVEDPNVGGSVRAAAYDISNLCVQAFSADNKPVADTKVKVDKKFKAVIRLEANQNYFVKAFNANSNQMFFKSLLPISKVKEDFELRVDAENTLFTNAFIVWNKSTNAKVKTMDAFNKAVDAVLNGSSLMSYSGFTKSQVIEQAKFDKADDIPTNMSLINEIERKILSGGQNGGNGGENNNPNLPENIRTELLDDEDVKIASAYISKPRFFVSFSRIGFDPEKAENAISIKDKNGLEITGIRKNWRGTKLVIDFPNGLEPGETYTISMANTQGFEPFASKTITIFGYSGKGTEYDPFYVKDVLTQAHLKTSGGKMLLIASATVLTSALKAKFDNGITFSASNVVIASGTEKDLWTVNGDIVGDNIVVPVPDDKLWPANSALLVAAKFSGVYKNRTYYFRTQGNDKATGAPFQTEDGKDLLLFDSSKNAYYIYTPGQLEAINNKSAYLSANFLQVRNIDLSNYTSSVAEANGGWKPIGDQDYPFLGNYDGNKLSIKGLHINNTTAFYTGLFGYVGRFGSGKKPEIKNVKLEDVQIKNTDQMHTAALIGLCIESTVDNCSSSGVVESNSQYVGGLIGNAIGSVIRNKCFSGGRVSSLGDSVEYTGGLVGYASNDTALDGCYSTAEVKGKDCVGGLVGRMQLNSANRVLRKSYATGQVSGANYVGGLVGYIDSVAIEDCYATGKVISVNGSNVGGLIGYCNNENNASIRVSKCYASGNVEAGTSTEVGGLIGFNSSIVSFSYSSGDKKSNFVSGKNNMGGLIGKNSGTVFDCYSYSDIVGYNADSIGLGSLIGVNQEEGKVSYSFFVLGREWQFTNAAPAANCHHIYKLPEGYIQSGKDEDDQVVTWQNKWENVFKIPSGSLCLPTLNL